MMVKDLIKQLKDMEMLYGNAVVTIIVDENEYFPRSISGYMGDKRPNECKDPNKVVITTKRSGYERRKG